MVFQDESSNFILNMNMNTNINSSSTISTYKPYTEFTNSYEILGEIGRGQFAIVKLCKNRYTGEERAAKFIRKRRFQKDRRGVSVEEIEREISILNDCSNHPNLISFFDVYENKDEIVLLLELARGIELFEFVRRRSVKNEIDALNIVRQILIGLKHLHNRDIVHLDLKPENIMYDPKDSHLKVIDFGLSRKILPGVKLRALVGTPEFVAPEIVDYETITLATDMWAIGVIAYNLLSGGLSPFLGGSKEITLSNVTKGDFPLNIEEFSSVSDYAKDFIRRLLLRDSRRRLTCDQCFKHPWLGRKIDLIIENHVSKDNSTNPNQRIVIRKRWKALCYTVLICNFMLKCERNKQENMQISCPKLSSKTTSPNGKKFNHNSEENNDKLHFPPSQNHFPPSQTHFPPTENQQILSPRSRDTKNDNKKCILTTTNNPYVKFFIGPGNDCAENSPKIPAKLIKNSIFSMMPRFMTSAAAFSFDHFVHMFFGPEENGSRQNLHNQNNQYSSNQYRHMSIAALCCVLASSIFGWICASYYLNNTFS